MTMAHIGMWVCICFEYHLFVAFQLTTKGKPPIWGFPYSETNHCERGPACRRSHQHAGKLNPLAGGQKVFLKRNTLVTL